MSYGELGPGPLQFESRPEPLVLSAVDEAEVVFGRLFTQSDININAINDQKLFLTTGDIAMFAQTVLKHTQGLADILSSGVSTSDSMAIRGGLLFGYHLGKAVYPKVGSIASTLQAEEPLRAAQSASAGEAFDLLNDCGLSGLNLLESDGGLVRDMVRRGNWETLEQWTLAETATGVGLYVYHLADVGRLRRERQKDIEAMATEVDQAGPIDWDAALRELTGDN